MDQCWLRLREFRKNKMQSNRQRNKNNFTIPRQGRKLVIRLVAVRAIWYGLMMRRIARPY